MTVQQIKDEYKKYGVSIFERPKETNYKRGTYKWESFSKNFKKCDASLVGSKDMLIKELDKHFADEEYAKNCLSQMANN